MSIYETHAKNLHDALATKTPYTFRHGKVLVTVDAVAYTGNMFSVLRATASYDAQSVPLDLPLHFVNATTTTDPLLDAQMHIAQTVRRIAGAI